MAKQSIRAQRKSSIIKSFYQVAKKEGLSNASIAKVARRAKVNPSLVMHYFNSRDELLLALNDFILERYLTIYQVKSPRVQTEEQLYEIIENLFSRKWNRLFDDGVFYSCYAEIYRNDQFKKSFKALHDQLHLRLMHVLDEACAQGILYHENTKELADHIFALVDGAYYYLGMVDDPKEREKRIESYQSLALEMLRMHAMK